MSNAEMVKVTVEGRQIEVKRERVVLCVDRSGSMGSGMTIDFHSMSRAKAASEAILAILDVSSPVITEYGIVAFDSSAQIVADPTSNYLTLMSKSYCGVQGSTDMYDGIMVSLTLSPSRLILLSDGAPNNDKMALDAARSAKERGVKIDTISIGDSDELLMKQIAELTGGTWRKCTNPDDLADAFMSLETVARLQIEHKA